MPDETPSDLLNGHAEIGAHLRMTERQAKHLAAIGAIPTFKLPGSNIVRARRSSIDAWLAEREAAARQEAEKSRQEAQDGREGGKGTPAASGPGSPATGQFLRSRGPRRG